ncbi:MAG TPA: hypothetical protein PKL97_10080, partial [Candidatus Omnitrophota bacterium]|nr:hypothetical protein [Candidatus Omnitrophota bacterium]
VNLLLLIAGALMLVLGVSIAVQTVLVPMHLAQFAAPLAKFSTGIVPFIGHKIAAGILVGAGATILMRVFGGFARQELIVKQLHRWDYPQMSDAQFHAMQERIDRVPELYRRKIARVFGDVHPAAETVESAYRYYLMQNIMTPIKTWLWIGSVLGVMSIAVIFYASIMNWFTTISIVAMIDLLFYPMLVFNISVILMNALRLAILGFDFAKADPRVLQSGLSPEIKFLAAPQTVFNTKDKVDRGLETAYGNWVNNFDPYLFTGVDTSFGFSLFYAEYATQKVEELKERFRRDYPDYAFQEEFVLTYPDGHVEHHFVPRIPPAPYEWAGDVVYDIRDRETGKIVGTITSTRAGGIQVQLTQPGITVLDAGARDFSQNFGLMPMRDVAGANTKMNAVDNVLNVAMDGIEYNTNYESVIYGNSGVAGAPRRGTDLPVFRVIEGGKALSGRTELNDFLEREMGYTGGQVAAILGSYDKQGKLTKPGDNKKLQSAVRSFRRWASETGLRIIDPRTGLPFVNPVTGRPFVDSVFLQMPDDEIDGLKANDYQFDEGDLLQPPGERAFSVGGFPDGWDCGKFDEVRGRIRSGAAVSNQDWLAALNAILRSRMSIEAYRTANADERVKGLLDEATRALLEKAAVDANAKLSPEELGRLNSGLLAVFYPDQIRRIRCVADFVGPTPAGKNAVRERQLGMQTFHYGTGSTESNEGAVVYNPFYRSVLQQGLSDEPFTKFNVSDMDNSYSPVRIADLRQNLDHLISRYDSHPYRERLVEVRGIVEEVSDLIRQARVRERELRKSGMDVSADGLPSRIEDDTLRNLVLRINRIKGGRTPELEYWPGGSIRIGTAKLEANPQGGIINVRLDIDNALDTGHNFGTFSARKLLGMLAQAMADNDERFYFGKFLAGEAPIFQLAEANREKIYPGNKSHDHFESPWIHPVNDTSLYMGEGEVDTANATYGQQVRWISGDVPNVAVEHTAFSVFLNTMTEFYFASKADASEATLDALAERMREAFAADGVAELAGVDGLTPPRAFESRKEGETDAQYKKRRAKYEESLETYQKDLMERAASGKFPFLGMAPMPSAKPLSNRVYHDQEHPSWVARFTLAAPMRGWLTEFLFWLWFSVRMIATALTGAVEMMFPEIAKTILVVTLAVLLASAKLTRPVIDATRLVLSPIRTAILEPLQSLFGRIVLKVRQTLHMERVLVLPDRLAKPISVGAGILAALLTPIPLHWAIALGFVVAFVLRSLLLRPAELRSVSMITGRWQWNSKTILAAAALAVAVPAVLFAAHAPLFAVLWSIPFVICMVGARHFWIDWLVRLGQIPLYVIMMAPLETN